MSVEKAWKDACRVLLGAEIGELGEYANYLAHYAKSLRPRASSISGASVWTAADICDGARMISNEQMPSYGGLIAKQKLEINELKDLDSLISGLQERFYYSGNIILGNSICVEASDRVFNSSFVRGSAEVYDSKCIAYSSTARYGEFLFGCDNVGQGSKFCIKGHDIYEAVRGFEVVRVFSSSDCYYAANLEGCTNCMFSFNLRKANHAIGNLELGKERYGELKAKLIEDIRCTLQSGKNAPTIFEIMGGKND